MNFASEEQLTLSALSACNIGGALGYREWTGWEATELKGFFGVPDLVLAFGRRDTMGRPILRTVAFEMKLKDWRRALVQAFRYKAFAQCAYVVMDRAFVHRAVPHHAEFDRAGIGLLSVSVSNKLCIHWRSRVSRPYADHTKRNFVETVAPKIFESGPDLAVNGIRPTGPCGAD